MKKLLSVIIMLSLASVCAFADTQAPAPVENDIDLDKIVVTTSRMAQHGYKIASDVSVINRSQIESSNAQNITEIIQKELGVYTHDTGTPKTAVIDIRGFGDTADRNVLVLVNDRRVNSIDISGPDTLQIPLGAVERIEIIRGAGSVLYGDNAVGGVVNIITKEGKGSLSGKLGSTLGSYSTSSVDAEVSGSKKFSLLNLDNDVSYFVYSKYFDTDGYRDNSNLLAHDHNARFGYKLSDKVSVHLDGGWHQDKYGLPGGLNYTELADLGRRGSADPDDFATTKDRFVQMGFDVKPWPENIDWGHFVVDFGYRNKDSYASFSKFFNTKRNLDTFNLNTKYVFDKTLFNRNFNFVTGIDFYDTNNDILGSDFNSDDLTISKKEIGYYAFSEYEVYQHLFFNAGTRFQEAHYEFDQRAATVGFTSDTPRESVNMAGLKYEYAKGSNIFASAQQTFRFLATDEWYDSFSGTLNTNLKQQTGRQYEVGIKHNLKDITLVSITPYWIDLHNEIFLNPSAGPFGANDNYDKTRRVGIEIGHTTNLSKLFSIPGLQNVEVFTNYAYQDPRFLKGVNDDKIIPMAPRHQVSFGLKTGFLDHFSTSLAGQYVGSTFAINDVSNITPAVKPYFLFDWKLSYTAKNWEVFTTINNIFDEQYYSYVVKSTTSDVKDLFPAPERNFTVGTKVKF